MSVKFVILPFRLLINVKLRIRELPVIYRRRLQLEVMVVLGLLA